MSSMCGAPEQSAYTSGRLAHGDERLFRPGGLQLTARAVALASLGAGTTVLDVGCGAGDSVRYLCTLGIDAIGVDCEASNDRITNRAIEPYTHIVANAGDLPFPTCSVDGVLAECSLSLMRDQDRTLPECARVLKDGGRLMISDLYARQPGTIAQVRALNRSCVAGMLVREEFEVRLVRVGFTVDVVEDHSVALRECAARYILEHGSLAGLWNCEADCPAEEVQAAMRAARAGYFLLIATRRRRSSQEGGWNHER